MSAIGFRVPFRREVFERPRERCVLDLPRSLEQCVRKQNSQGFFNGEQA